MKSVLYDPNVLKQLVDDGMIKCRLCSQQEADAFHEREKQGKPLPHGIFEISVNRKNSYIEVDPLELTPENEQRIQSYLQVANSSKQIEYLSSIKQWLTFFGVLTILGLIGGFITICSR
jgi:hypothetical protein